MVVVLSDTAVSTLAHAAHDCGVHASRLDCWRVLEQIAKKGHITDRDTLVEFGLLALTTIPRPGWVQQLIGG